MDPNNYEEKRILLQLLPQVVWTIIFKYLELFTDSLESISNSSVVLREWMGTPNRFLLSRVLPFLEPELHPTQPPLLPPLELLGKLRLVSKTWSRAVDNLAHPLSTNFRSCLATRLSTLHFHNVPGNQEADFLSHFEATHPADGTRSPFVGDSLRIFYCARFWGPNPANGNLNGLVDPPNLPFSSVLLKYGHQIRFCEIFLTSDIPRNSSWPARALVNLWSSLTNVETLILVLRPRYQVSNSHLNATDLAALNDAPEKPTLKRLHAKGIAYQILAKVLAKAPNLEHFDVGYMTPYDHHLVPQAIDKLIVDKVQNASLRHLGVHVMTKYPYLFGRQRYIKQDDGFHKAFESLAHQQGSQIQSLELMVTCTTTAVWLEWTRHLIYFPNLKSFKLITKNWPCIDFLGRMKDTLEFLCIEIDAQETFAEWQRRLGSAELMGNELIKFLGCYGNMMESNMWNLMPNLKRITVREIVPNAQKLKETVWNRNKQNCRQKSVQILELAENFHCF